jgi:tRNA dimethylallyltransferase
MEGVGLKGAVLIAGPTASGKSALAIEAAERFGGVVVNADSMQVYRDLRVLTARPGEIDEARVPHFLFGHVDAAENYSVGRYTADAAEILRRLPRDKIAIVVGGTGLYFKVLTSGLAAIPPIDPAIRSGLRERLAQEGVAALHAELVARDPASGKIMPRDRSRTLRALEVLEATGRPISDWHREGLPPALDPEKTARIFLHPHRDALFRHVAGGRSGRGARPRRAASAGDAAGDEGAWRAVAAPASARRDCARGGGGGCGDGYAPLCQAAGHLVPQPDAGLDLGRTGGGDGGAGAADAGGVSGFTAVKTFRSSCADLIRASISSKKG